MAKAAAATFFWFFLTACDGVSHSSGWAVGSDGEECRVPTKSGGLLVATSVVICQTIEKIGVLEFFHGSEFDVVLGYIAFERAREIGWFVGDSIERFPCVWGAVSVDAVSVIH